MLDFEPELLAVVTLATEGLLSSPKPASAGDSVAAVFPLNPVPGVKAGGSWGACERLSLESPV
jgi:hypothetical protein